MEKNQGKEERLKKIKFAIWIMNRLIDTNQLLYTQLKEIYENENKV